MLDYRWGEARSLGHPLFGIGRKANAGFLSSPSKSSFSGSVDVSHHADVASCFVVFTLIDAQRVDPDVVEAIERKTGAADALSSSYSSSLCHSLLMPAVALVICK